MADCPAPRAREPEKPRQKRSSRVEVDGWINLDKPTGVSSTQAVGRLKFLFNAKKAGHAGTLDPLASGVLPVAFGEATKTVPIVQDGAKAYRFRVRWGEESATDDAEGEIVARSDRRPAPAEIEALLPRFVGVVLQTPPTFSAIRIDGARAYDLAREGESFRDSTAPDQRLPAQPDFRRAGRRSARGRVRQGRLRARDRTRSRPRARLLRPCDRIAPDPRRPVFRRCGGRARSPARRPGPDGPRASAGAGGSGRNPAPGRRPRRRRDVTTRPEAASPRSRPDAGAGLRRLLRDADRLRRRSEDGYFVSTRVFNLRG